MSVILFSFDSSALLLLFEGRLKSLLSTDLFELFCFLILHGA